MPIITGDSTSNTTISSTNVLGRNLTVSGILSANAETISGNLTVGSQLNLPLWTTSTRPTSPTTGLMGYNTTQITIETWSGTSWVFSSTPTTYSVSYLVVAGGGVGVAAASASACCSCARGR